MIFLTSELANKAEIAILSARDTTRAWVPGRGIMGRNVGVYKYGLLTKCEVKMAGYWPSVFFACLWTETKSRSINSQKKNEANIQPS